MPKGNDNAPAKPAPNRKLLSLDAWLNKRFPPREFMLGELLCTTSRMFLIGYTGLGKTHIAMAIAFAVAAGKSLLHWRGSAKPRRVLYIDGEMSVELLKERLEQLIRRNDGVKPAHFYVLSNDEFSDMPPLNTEDGQDYVDEVISSVGGIDLIVFDNLSSLLAGSQKEEETWQGALPWIKSLTRRRIGQLWIDHTGYDRTRSYGLSLKERQFDTLALMTKVEGRSDIAFELSFTKHRMRTPKNRADFEPCIVVLADDKWTSDFAMVRTTNMSKRARLALDVLVARGGKALQKEWRFACRGKLVSKKGAKNESHDRVFKAAVKELVAANAIRKYGTPTCAEVVEG